MKKTKTYRVLLDPTRAQVRLFEQILGARAYVWNICLEQRNIIWNRLRAVHPEDRAETLSRILAVDLGGGPQKSRVRAYGNMQRKQVTALRKEPGMEWLAAVPPYPLGKTIDDLEKAYQRAFERLRKGQKPGFPRFHSGRRERGFKLSAKHTIVVDGHRLNKLPNVGSIRIQRDGYLPDGAVVADSISIVREIGKWWVNVTVTEIVDEPIATGEAIGVDVGIRKLATLSDGTTFENPKAFVATQKKLRRLQRKRDRQKLGSANRRKTNQQIAKTYAKATRIRQRAIHHVTAEIVKRKPRVVVIETLNVAGMSKNPKLSKHILDAGMSELHRQMKYKSEWAGIEVKKADPFFPSSRVCNTCGVVAPKFVSETFTCAECGHTEDRDIHAARNLAALANV